MKRSTCDARGFTHFAALGAIGVVLVIGATFVAVLKAHHNAKDSTQTALTTSSAQNKLSANGSAQSGVSSLPSQSTTSSSSPSSTKASSTPAKSAPSSTPTTSTPTSTATPTTTPLEVLTQLISSVQAGGQANVTAASVTIPGPISNATGRPIVFTANGQTYFAYRQEKAPDFSTSASDTAGTMAIVNATVSNAATVQAHLDKAGNLVDPNFQAVGFSTGGD